MRLSLIILLFAFVSSCSNGQGIPLPTVPVQIKVDSFEIYKAKYDSLKIIKDSLRIDLTRANFKLVRIKYYTDLCDKNPKKYGIFLRGWNRGIFENQNELLSEADKKQLIDYINNLK